MPFLPYSLYAHGGPGLNSFAEKAILGPMAEQAGVPIVFWNEPSKLRPDGWKYVTEHPYLNWITSLEASVRELAGQQGPINLIAHSFAGGPAIELARKIPGSIASVTLIAGSFDPAAAGLKIMNLAAGDFEKAGRKDEASRLRSTMSSIHALGDESMIGGFMQSVNDPALFSHYFFDPAQLQKAFAAMAQAGPQGQVDLDSLQGVFGDMFTLGMHCYEGPAIGQPVLYVLGDSDQVLDLEAEGPLQERYIKHINIKRIERAGHFVHLDQPELFIDRLKSFLQGLKRP